MPTYRSGGNVGHDPPLASRHEQISVHDNILADCTAGGTWQEAVKGYGVSRDAFYKTAWRVILAINHTHTGMLSFTELESEAELNEIEAGFAKLTNGVVRGCVGVLLLICI